MARTKSHTTTIGKYCVPRFRRANGQDKKPYLIDRQVHMPRIELGFHRWQQCVITIIPHVFAARLGLSYNMSSKTFAGKLREHTRCNAPSPCLKRLSHTHTPSNRASYWHSRS